MSLCPLPWCVRHSSTPPGGTVHHGEPATVRAGDDLVTVALLSDSDTPDVYVEVTTTSGDVLLSRTEANELVDAIASSANSAS